jgi:hypothetical protein
LDTIYRHAIVLSRTEAARHQPFQEATAVSREGGTAVFPIPRFPAEVVAITTELTVRPGCKVEARVLLVPHRLDLALVSPEEGFLAFQFGASRWDRAELEVEPGPCVQMVRFSIEPLAAMGVGRAGLPEGRVVETNLFRQFLTARKNAEGDELYDLSADPAMQRNLAGSPGSEEPMAQMRLRTSRLFGSLAALGPQHAVGPQTAEEIRKLRSLGYLQ